MSYLIGVHHDVVKVVSIDFPHRMVLMVLNLHAVVGLLGILLLLLGSRFLVRCLPLLLSHQLQFGPFGVYHAAAFPAQFVHAERVRVGEGDVARAPEAPVRPVVEAVHQLGHRGQVDVAPQQVGRFVLEEMLG